jgi:hypothetical protein
MEGRIPVYVWVRLQILDCDLRGHIMSSQPLDLE